MNFNRKIILCASLLILLISFQNFTTLPDKSSQAAYRQLQKDYLVKAHKAIDEMDGVKLELIVSDKNCTTDGSSMEGKPYETEKIADLSSKLKNFREIYPYVSNSSKAKIIAYGAAYYNWIVKKLDQKRNLIKDDYGMCHKEKATSYSHLTTPYVIGALASLREILPKNHSHYGKLSDFIEVLAIGHLNSVDNWMTPIDQKMKHPHANYMSKNLIAAHYLNVVDRNNSYLRNHLDHRIKTDYAWIRKSFTNYSSEQLCGVPLLYGGWSHQTAENVARNDGFKLTCDLFSQKNMSDRAIKVRKFYIQKVSYHGFITRGLIGLHKTLVDRRDCDLVDYGSNGTCADIRMLLKGGASWLYEIIQKDGSIAQASESWVYNPKQKYEENDYYDNNYGTIGGISNLVEILDYLKKTGSESDPQITYGYSDQPRKSIKFSQMNAKVLKSLKFAVEQNRPENVIGLGDAPFVAAKVFNSEK